MGHHYTGPKDKTNPLMYVPIALLGAGLVAWVFASGFMRGQIAGAKPTATVVRKSAKPKVNVKELAEATPELVNKGKALYGINCVSCHGAEGYGDGDKGTSLNPKPRNFHSEAAWKNGPEVGHMWKTLEEGVPGSSMSSYQLMPEDERIAIIHYIRETWVPNPPEVTADDIAVLPGGSEEVAADGSAGPTGNGPDKDKIMAALNSRIRPFPEPVEYHPPAEWADLPGAVLYGANCASCHGEAGGGVETYRVMGSAPYVRISTRSLTAAKGAWLQDEDAFADLLVRSEPGAQTHGFATLTNQQLNDLHEYVAKLASQGRPH